jgi:hypothetical protein
MKRLQVSILTLILPDSYPHHRGLRDGLHGFADRLDFWLSALYTFTTVLLLVAVIAARYRRGNEKAFWFWFAVFGWGFFLLGYGPWRTATSDPTEQRVPLNRNLVTSKVILFLVAYLITDSDDLEDVDKITANTISIAQGTMMVHPLGGRPSDKGERGTHSELVRAFASPMKSLVESVILVRIPGTSPQTIERSR